MRASLSILLLVFTVAIQAQDRKQIHIKRAVGPISIDGKLDEQSWLIADIGDDYHQQFPTDTVPANAKTELRLTYDDKYLYVGAKMLNPGPRTYVTPSLRRDFRGGGNDMFIIGFDTFDDRTNAFQFGINPFGVRREGLLANGGAQPGDLSLDWENKWVGEATQHDGYWIAEMAIPFKSIRFKEGSTVWNLHSYRIDSGTGERSTWSPVPRNFRLYSQAHAGELIWDEPLGKPGANVAVIPYVSAGYQEDNTIDPNSVNADANLGFDAKVGVGPALNLDITVNPDFSQVEVDRQVTNLDRFEIFFPERRQFFLENADLFSQFGIDQQRPFFSRRIGVSRDPNTGVNIQNKIDFGLRLSGKLSKNWRVGYMSMKTAAIENNGIPEFNFNVAAIQRKVFARSNIGFIFVNKQSLDGLESVYGEFPILSLRDRDIEHSRVVGLDYNLASADNKWNAKFYYHKSFDEFRLDDAYSTAATVLYSTIDWQVSGLVQSVGTNYNPEVGFARRRNFDRVQFEIQKNFYPESSVFQSINPNISVERFENDINGTTDSQISLGVNGQLLSTARYGMGANRNFIYLFSDFDPTGSGNTPLAQGTEYTYFDFVAFIMSDTRKPFFYTLRSNVGEYFNGNRYSIGGNINYRILPLGIISMNFNYNHIRLPEPYGDADLLLIGPRIDLTFTKKLFWTTFIQYNSQIDNININSRLQWRFKPVSDLFIAYTDNYTPDGLINKNRGLVMKLTYWLNF